MPGKSRRQQEINRLIGERTQMKKQWKKVSAERDSLTPLQIDFKS